jgi:hypothetical protein
MISNHKRQMQLLRRLIERRNLKRNSYTSPKLGMKIMEIY